MSDSPDWNLLLGIIAYQNELITREQLLAGMHAWSLEKNVKLAEHLERLGALQPDQRKRLEMLVKANLALHQHDPQQSLSEFSSLASSLQQELTALADPDIDATLIHLANVPSKLSLNRAPVSSNSSNKSSRSGNRFKILRPHARGGLGEVSVAEDQELHREVAFKEIHADKADHPELRTRFIREAEITGGLEHPGIVPVYGLGAYPDGRPFYAMRFIRGDSLDKAIRKYHSTQADTEHSPSATEQNLHLRRLLQRFIDVCEAMDYAHNRGVLHRDLKPGNIMLGRYGETLVVDWGLAKLLGEVPEQPLAEPQSEIGLELSQNLEQGALQPSAEAKSSDLTQDGTTIGTLPYMSPEQANGRLDLLGPASDVFSLGATLFEIITDRPPYQGKRKAVLEAAQQGNVPAPRSINSKIPKPLEAICLKALAKKPSDRYATAKGLADDVEAYLADEPTTALPDTKFDLLTRWVRKNRKLAIGIAIFTIIGTIFTALTGYLLVHARNLESLAEMEAFHHAKAQAIDLSRTKPPGWDGEAYGKLVAMDLENDRFSPYAPEVRGLMLRCRTAHSLMPDRVLIPNFVSESICVFEDGKTIAVGESRVPFTKPFARVRIFDSQSNTTISELTHDFTSHIGKGLANLLSAETFKATRAEGISTIQSGRIRDKEYLAVGSRFGEIFLWDPSSPTKPSARWNVSPDQAINAFASVAMESIF